MNLGQPDQVPDFDNSNCVTDETELLEMMSKVTIQMNMVSKAISLFMMGMRK